MFRRRPPAHRHAVPPARRRSWRGSSPTWSVGTGPCNAAAARSGPRIAAIAHPPARPNRVSNPIGRSNSAGGRRWSWSVVCWQPPSCSARCCGPRCTTTRRTPDLPRRRPSCRSPPQRRRPPRPRRRSSTSPRTTPKATTARRTTTWRHAPIDGDPATVWSTLCYGSRTLGGKGGVGLVADLGTPAIGTFTVSDRQCPVPDPDPHLGRRHDPGADRRLGLTAEAGRRRQPRERDGVAQQTDPLCARAVQAVGQDSGVHEEPVPRRHLRDGLRRQLTARAAVVSPPSQHSSPTTSW